jgi:Uri superfamily endonuclease
MAVEVNVPRFDPIAASDPRIRSISGKGTYVLYMELKSDTRIRVGKLGAAHFTPGCYAYVGRAFGPGGLAARLVHHLSRPVAPHWHVDYLRRRAAVREIWHARTRPSAEHRWAQALSRIRGAELPIHGFGSSDCGCPSHLVRLYDPPSKSTFRRHLRRLPGGVPAAIHRLVF